MKITITESEINILFNREEEPEKVRKMIEFILSEFPNDYHDKEPFRQPSKETKIIQFE